MKRRSKLWLRVSEKIAADAAEYARSIGAEFVFCGHTHQAMEYSSNGVRYFNSGCWTDLPSQFITVDKSSGVMLREYR